MAKWITDVHNHSAYSFDGTSSLRDMLATALEKGVAFYGTVEHFDYDVVFAQPGKPCGCDEEGYFHEARHLQDDYAGAMNVSVGVEFGFAKIQRALEKYQEIYEKHRPDFVVSSVHCVDGLDYYFKMPFYDENGEVREKQEVYEEYLRLVYDSLFAPYPVDILAHLSYPTRYAPYADRAMRYVDYAEAYDRILKAVIEKNIILEVNSSCDGGVGIALPDRDLLERYFQLGGRLISYASDAHNVDRIVKYRERTVALLKEIGFTHITVPTREGRVQVEI